MKKAEIKVGGLYTARVNGNHTTVRVDNIRDRGGISGVHYDVTNLSTGRRTTFHSAAKFRSEVTKLDPTGLTADAWETKCGICGKTDQLCECPVLDESEIVHPTMPSAESVEAGNRAALDAVARGDIAGAEDILRNDDMGKLLTKALGEGEQCCPFASSDGTSATVEQQSSDTSEGEQGSDPQIESGGVATIQTAQAVQEVESLTKQSTVQYADSSFPVGATSSTGCRSFAAKIATMQSTRVTRVPETVAGYTPTDEQRTILEAVLEILSTDCSKVLVVNAGAGSGKTSTLKMLEDVLYGQIQYTAYNRPLVDESKSKFRKAKCSTSHGLAFGPVGSSYKHRLNGGRVRSWAIAQKLGIEDYCVTCTPYPKGSVEWTEAAQAAGYDDTDNLPPADFRPAPIKKLKAGFLAGHVSQALKKFSQTTDLTIDRKHFSYIPGIDEVDEDTGRRGRVNNDAVVEYLLPFARKFWDDVCDVDGTLPFQHDYYVKMWQLQQNCVIPADHILLDEHQDTAPVFADVIRRQSATVVLVGDENQRIYEWRGAMNAADLFPDAPVLYLSQSFRFGQTVADVANSVLSYLQEPTKLNMRGLATIPSRVLLDLPEDEWGNKTADDVQDQHVGDVCYLYRTNAGAVARIITEYARGRRGALVGKVDEVVSFVRAAQDLQEGRSTTHPELAVFENWLEVQKYVEEDPDGGDLKLMVKLIDQFTCDSILEALSNMPAEKEADFVCGTAHKSKGREWDTVVLGADFPPLHKMQDSDVRLLYVALTRPRLVLDLTHCTPFHTYKDKDGNEYPCIEVNYTVPMPTAGELAMYQVAKLAADFAAPKTATAALPQSSGPIPAAAPRSPATGNVASANGNGSSRPPVSGFTWTNFSGKWLVRGPHDAELGKSVEVVAKSGRRETKTLRSVVRKFDDASIYEV